MCTHTGLQPSVITVGRCYLDWSDKGSSVMVRKTGRWLNMSLNVSEKLIINSNQLCSTSSTPLLPGSLIYAAPCRMWTKLPQTLCIQHPEQLQWSSEKASVHHLSEQQPVPASVHHWINIQCRDSIHLRRRCCPHPLTHTNGTDKFMCIIWFSFRL